MSLSPIDKALDQVFSLWIRCAAHWKCQACGRAFNPPKQMEEFPDEYFGTSLGLHCSHFWGKGSGSVWTKWNGPCADALCAEHHTKWEHLKGPGQEYRMRKIEQVGMPMFRYMDWLSTRHDPMHLQVKEFRLFELISLVKSAKYKHGWLFLKYEDLLPSIPLPYNTREEALEL
jgi:hypothetical protein